MGIGVNKSLDKLALVAEIEEGTAVAANTAANYVGPIAEGLSFNLEREEIERNLLNDSAEIEASRVGTSTVSGEVSFECRANSTTGGAPVDLDLSLRSLLGGKRNSASVSTVAASTATVLKFANHSFKVGDSVLVKIKGKFEIRPVTKTTDTEVTLAFALASAPATGVSVEAVTTYFPDTKSSITLTAEHYQGNEIKSVIAGLRAVNGSLSDWSTGNIPKMAFSFNGLSMDLSNGSSNLNPAANTALPPVILSSCAWLNGTKLEYNDLALSIENTIADLPSACSKSGKIGSRITQQLVTGSINPYMEDDDVDRFKLFDKNKDISLFVYAFNPTESAGEFNQAIALWIPQGRITALPKSDLNGIYTDDVQFKAHRGSGKDSVFISFI